MATLHQRHRRTDGRLSVAILRQDLAALATLRSALCILSRVGLMIALPHLFAFRRLHWSSIFRRLLSLPVSYAQGVRYPVECKNFSVQKLQPTGMWSLSLAVKIEVCVFLPWKVRQNALKCVFQSGSPVSPPCKMLRTLLVVGELIILWRYLSDCLSSVVIFFTRWFNIFNSFLLSRNSKTRGTVNSFKTNIDKCWHSQDVYFDYKCDIAGTGNRSNSNK